MRLIDSDALIAKFKDDLESLQEFEFQLATIGAINTVKHQPTIDAVPQWIPCSERMPQWWWINPEADEEERIWDGEKVIVCGTIGDWPYSGVACGMYGPDGWSIEDDAFSDDDVPVAWMPMPEPYRAERKEE